MNTFFSQIPKPLLAALLLMGGIVLMILSNPPHHLCLTQLESFREEVGDYLFINKVKQQKIKEELKSGFQKDMMYCQNSNSPGGCYEFFFNFKKMLQSLNTVSSECQPSVGALKEVKTSLWKTLELMIKIAWGHQPPKGIYDKYSWMDLSDMSLFCRVKDLIQRLYPKNSWEKFQGQVMKELPDSKSLPREKVWELTILSDNCTRF